MTISAHICKDKEVNGVPFTAKIITGKGAANVRTFRKMETLGYICVHNTGNSSASAGDENHASYLQNVENADEAYISWHITVDCDSATQHLPFDEVAYHAGDGAAGPGNGRSIGIEIAENRDYRQSEENAVKIITALMQEYGIPPERVLPHRFFAPNKKLCPHLILKSEKTWAEDWAAFQDRLSAAYFAVYGSLYGTKETPAPETRKPKTAKVLANLNLRGKPSLDGEIRAVVRKGTILTLKETAKGELKEKRSGGFTWIAAEYEGKTVYAAKEYLSLCN